MTPDGLPPASGLAVVKVGGGLSATEGALAQVGKSLAQAARVARFVVIPGGGPFADAVREFDRRVGLSADAAHWMAVLGMDQYAHAIASHTPAGRVVEEAAEITPTLNQGALPILAPSRWLRAADELPHSWEVTSDSLAAYLAGLLGADHLVLIKPVLNPGSELTDRYFSRALPAGMDYTCLEAGRLQQLGEIINRGRGR